ncbi:MAG TPA: alpha/beta hydrolase [Chloroflexota bacterium]|nr:alpha/beta hydrolase [Chloroflexota bacterium]
MEDPRLRVCLERTVELGAVRLALRDWPGLAGPLVHVADPFSPASETPSVLAEALVPIYRVVSLSPRGNSPYQVDTSDLLGTLDQFGFVEPTLVGERLGCVAALLLAAWYPERVGRLVLIDPTYDPPASDNIAARALLDCPPDWPALRARTRCPVLVVRWSASSVGEITTFLSGQPAMPRS